MSIVVPAWNCGSTLVPGRILLGETSSILPHKGSKLSKSYNQTRHRKNQMTFVIFSAPALIWYLVVMGWPMVNMIYMSTLHWEGLLKPQTFIGIDNYIRIIHDVHFSNSLRNTAIYLLVAVPGVLFPAYAMGFFLSQRRFGYRILRLIYFSPIMLSLAVVAMMFNAIYLPDGLLDGLLKALGLGSLIHLWLADSQTALPAIMALDLWGGLGYYAVIFSAALDNVPRDLYEAASLDGAHPWTLIWKIAFPITRDFFGVMAILQFLYVLVGTAGSIWLLTKGGPGDSTTTLSYFMFNNGIALQHLGYSQAIGVLLFLFGLIGMLLIRRLTRRID